MTHDHGRDLPQTPITIQHVSRTHEKAVVARHEDVQEILGPNGCNEPLQDVRPREFVNVQL